MRPLRGPAIGLGCTYLVAIALLGPLLGSSADASTAFAEHFDDDGNRVRDLFGSLALLVAAAMLVWTAVTALRSTSPTAESSVRDLSAIAGGHGVHAGRRVRPVDDGSPDDVDR